MTDFSKLNSGLGNMQKSFDSQQASNPLSFSAAEAESALSNFSQSLPRSTYDSDMAELLEVVRILNNMAPIRMPVYNFNLEEINGERYYKPDGTMLLVREYDGDVIRDYYTSKKNPQMVDRILEHDKINGRLRTKIEPNPRAASSSRVNITIFDEKINRKYTIMQLTEDGFVNNITEFSGQGKSFQTLFRNIKNFKPARYLEGKETAGKSFEMVDCIFDNDGNIARIKKYNNKREINIEYTEDRKNISVRTLNK